MHGAAGTFSTGERQMYGDAQADKVNYNEKAQSVLGQQAQPELASLLGTINAHANELRGLVVNIFSRVSSLPEEECADRQPCGSNYVGQAEQTRSTLRETVRLLNELAKVV
jgi:hypothetical protein